MTARFPQAPAPRAKRRVHDAFRSSGQPRLPDKSFNIMTGFYGGEAFSLLL